jgi:hypothetical protein
MMKDRHAKMKYSAFGWLLATALCSAAFALHTSAAEPPVNYDETKVTPYTLEDPLTFADGTKLKNAAEWPKRRAEILDIFAKEMYGAEPPKPEAVVTELIEHGTTLASLAVREQVRMWFRKDKTGPFIDWLLVLPHRIQDEKPQTADRRIVCENRAKVPIILMLNFPGNHAVLDDAEVLLTEGGSFRADGDSGESSLQYGIHACIILKKYADVKCRSPLGAGMWYNMAT